MQHFRYAVSGLLLETDVEIPGLSEVPEPGVEAGAEAGCGSLPRVEVRRAPTDEPPLALRGAPLVGGSAQFAGVWQLSDDEMLFRVPGVVSFRMTGGSCIEYQTAADEPDFRPFLIGSALGALLHQRGELVLHGSAVDIGGAAALFCGPSGSGKSSLVARLCARGYPLVADDVCAIAVDEQGSARLFPDGRRLKLWADSVAGLGLTHRAGRQIRRGLEKYWVEPHTVAATPSPLPVAHVYFLRDVQPPDNEPGIEPLDLLGGAEAIRAHAYRPRLVRVLGQDALWLHHSLRLLRQAPAAWLTRERRFEALDACVDGLEQSWKEQRNDATSAAAA